MEALKFHNIRFRRMVMATAAIKEIRCKSAHWSSWVPMHDFVDISVYA
jgi:hypothetical protein